MKILVAVKRVLDYSAQIRIKNDESGVETANIKMVMNPFDEIAVEEAVRLKEKGLAQEIVVVTLGVAQAQETLRTALAMGADRGILIQTDQEIQPLAAAKLLRSIVQKETPDLIILGKQAVDMDNNQVGQMLAALLDLPQATFASQLMIENKRALVTREIDGGLETLSLHLPAIVTTDLRLNEPRYLSLPNIVQAKRKPIAIIPLEELSIDIVSHIKILKVTGPEKRCQGIKVATVSELVEKLTQEARVL